MNVKDDNNEAIAVSITEAARLSALSEKTIRRAVWGKSLPSYKVGKRIVIKVDDLRGWLFSVPYEGDGAVEISKFAPRIGPADLGGRPEPRKVRAATPAA